MFASSATLMIRLFSPQQKLKLTLNLNSKVPVMHYQKSNIATLRIQSYTGI